MAKGFVYILRSLKTNKLYVGSTTDISRRMHQHEIGCVRSTNSLRPLKLELFQEYDSIKLAREIERSLKRLKRKDYLEKIIQERLIKLGLPQKDAPRKIDSGL
jgi:putative endonuclease